MKKERGESLRKSEGGCGVRYIRKWDLVAVSLALKKKSMNIEFLQNPGMFCDYFSQGRSTNIQIMK